MALIYTVVGLVIAVAGGTVIQHLHMDDQVADFVRGEAVDAVQAETMTKQERATYALGQTAETFKKVFPFILLGVAIGALIHNWIPQDIVEAVLGDGNPFAVVLLTLIGAPHLRRHLQHHPDRRGALRQGRGTRHHPRVHDERHRALDPLAHHALARGEAEASPRSSASALSA